jgi:hypothetical protein
MQPISGQCFFYDAVRARRNHIGSIMMMFTCTKVVMWSKRFSIVWRGYDSPVRLVIYVLLEHIMEATFGIHTHTYTYHYKRGNAAQHIGYTSY